MNAHTINRLLAIIYAIGVGFGEIFINASNWQRSPMWIINGLIALVLVVGAFKGSAKWLLMAWSFTTGIAYMALFISLASEQAEHFETPPTTVILAVLLFLVSLTGVGLSWRHTSNQSSTRELSR